MKNGANRSKLITIFSIYFSFILLSWAVTSDTIVLSDVLGRFGYVGEREGITSAMKSVGSILALGLIFVATGRIKKPLLILITGVLGALAFYMLGSTDMGGFFLMWTLISGFGEASVDSLMNSYLLDVNGTENSIFMNMLHGFYGIGGIVGPAVFAVMYLKRDYRYIYHAAGVLLLVALVQFGLVTLLTKKKLPAGQTPQEAEPISGRDMLSYVTNKRNIVIMLCMLFAQAAQKCLSVWVTRYCEVVLDDFETGAICVSALWIGVTLSRFLFPLLKIKLEKSIGWCMIASGAGFILGALMNSPAVMLGATAFFGLSSGSVVPDIITFAARGYESKSTLPTTMMGLMMFGAGLVLSLLMTLLIRIAGIKIAVIVIMLLSVSTGVLALFSFRPSAQNKASDPV